jgi:PIN domain nuclease of toxin-antitoxin system
MEYVTDTHPLVWSLFASNRLSTHVRDLFQRVELGEHIIVIPTVVIAELIMVVEKGRVSGTMSELLQGLGLLQASANYRFPALLPETVIASHVLTTIPDIFDRLVVAEAQRLSLPLITRDAIISASGLVTTIWD